MNKIELKVIDPFSKIKVMEKENEIRMEAIYEFLDAADISVRAMNEIHAELHQPAVLKATKYPNIDTLTVDTLVEALDRIHKILHDIK